MSPWPFDQPPNCAVISLRSIVFDGAPILRVTHDSDDDGWQFLEFETPSVEEAAVVAFREIVNLDPSLVELAGLPPGWRAIRSSVGDAWRRELNPHDPGNV